jgi:hypothetical protein
VLVNIKHSKDIIFYYYCSLLCANDNNQNIIVYDFHDLFLNFKRIKNKNNEIIDSTRLGQRFLRPQIYIIIK